MDGVSHILKHNLPTAESVSLNIEVTYYTILFYNINNKQVLAHGNQFRRYGSYGSYSIDFKEIVYLDAMFKI